MGAPIRIIRREAAWSLAAWRLLAESPALGASFFCALGAVSAQVRVPLPFTPVPMTLQALVALLAGFALRPAAAAYGMVFYLMLGTAGAPVFAPDSLGLAGVTGGYLAAFAPAAALVSYFSRRGTPRFRRDVLAAGVGMAVILVCGVCWQALQWGSVAAAARMGLIPFLPKAAVEIALAAGVVAALRGGYKPRKS